MITVNGKKYPHKDGLTVEKLLKEKGYVYPRITVRINGKVIEEEDYSNTIIKKGDQVQCLHLMAGG
ncbi:sulfur carrier protein ThiS [Clostridium sp. Cult2]|uniref:sulfur carrier protein ThiS n=1 Tax=Clostridium sp. Cult2 TaxID=2079003 RepID=UPI001F002CFE|nr:sulfur carrier protein ThiS [Clostridium sp. Cult2]MCF6464516.1 thiamine biosynthesis protein ThiS [Clostridium sp. Cult2]